MKYAYIKKRISIQLILLAALYSLVACDVLPNEPKKIEFLDKSFSVMMPASWSIRSDLNDTADLQMGSTSKEAYAIIISENKMDIDVTSLGGHSNITRSFLKEGVKNYHESGPEMLDNGEYRTLRYQLTGTVDRANIVYWHVTIETKEHYHQMLLWSLKSKFSKNEADFIAVIQSFEEINERTESFTAS